MMTKIDPNIPSDAYVAAAIEDHGFTVICSSRTGKALVCIGSECEGGVSVSHERAAEMVKMKDEKYYLSDEDARSIMISAQCYSPSYAEQVRHIQGSLLARRLLP